MQERLRGTVTGNLQSRILSWNENRRPSSAW
jgi:hypothetical protein